MTILGLEIGKFKNQRKWQRKTLYAEVLVVHNHHHDDEQKMPMTDKSQSAFFSENNALVNVKWLLGASDHLNRIVFQMVLITKKALSLWSIILHLHV